MKITKNLLSLFILTALLSGCGAKHAEFGNWTTRLPEDHNYFYAVGGPNESRPVANDSARTEMAKFIQVTVDAEIDRILKARNEEVDRRFFEQVRIQAKETLRYVSIVEVRKLSEGYYALARMPRRPIDEILEKIKFIKIPPGFGEIARSAVIPGWGQFHKGQTKKGMAILGSESLLVGGSLILLSLRDDAADKSLRALTAGARKTYRDRKENYERLMLGTVIGAGVVYLYNLVDVTTVPRKVEADSVPLSFNASLDAVVLRYQWRLSGE